MSKSDMRARRDSMDCILCEVNGKAPGFEAASGEKRASQSSTFAAGAARSESCDKVSVGNDDDNGNGERRTTSIISSRVQPTFKAMSQQQWSGFGYLRQRVADVINLRVLTRISKLS